MVNPSNLKINIPADARPIDTAPELLLFTSSISDEFSMTGMLPMLLSLSLSLDGFDLDTVVLVIGVSTGTGGVEGILDGNCDGMWLVSDKWDLKSSSFKNADVVSVGASTYETVELVVGNTPLTDTGKEHLSLSRLLVL